MYWSTYENPFIHSFVHSFIHPSCLTALHVVIQARLGLRIAHSFIYYTHGIPIHLSSKHRVAPPIPELTPLTPPTRPPFLSLSMISVASCARSVAVAPNACVQKTNFGVSRAVYASAPAQSLKRGLFTRYELSALVLPGLFSGTRCSLFVLFPCSPVPLFLADAPTHRRTDALTLMFPSLSSSVCVAARAARRLGP